MAKKKSKKEKNKSWNKIKAKQAERMARNPHRSFQLTKRRDYAVKLPLHSYTNFTVQVFAFLNKNRNTFLLLALTGCIMALFTSSFMSQTAYLETISNLIKLVDSETSSVTQLFGQASKLSGSFVLGLLLGSTQNVTPYMVIAGILIWLTSIWLVRNLVAKKKVKLRDGLYNSGGPIVPSVMVVMVMGIQAIPLVLAIGVLRLAEQGGLMEHGAIAMAFSIGLSGVGLLSLYWMVSTLIALIIVTLPGIRPMESLRMARDLTSGIRLRILYRITWMTFVMFLFWLVTVGLTVALELTFRAYIEWLSAVPIVPFVILIMTIASIIWVSVYTYMLYLEIVEARYGKRQQRSS